MVRPASGSGLESVATWAHAERCRRLIGELAEDLAPYGIRLLAVKGVHLAFAVAPEPWFRPMADADALVVGASFGRTVALIETMGRWRLSGGWSSVDVTSPSAPGVSIDLHRQALPPFFARMSTETLRARAHDAKPPLSRHLLVPDPLDAGALAVAHFVKDSVGAIGGNLAVDLALLAANAGVTPSTLADRVIEHGLRRKAIVAFTALAACDHVWDVWLEPLAPTAIERCWAKEVVRAIRAIAPEHPTLSFAIAASASDDLPRGVASVGFAAIRYARSIMRAAARRF